MEELAAVCHAADSYGAYKKRVSMAVRERDMQVAQKKWHRLMLCNSRPLLAICLCWDQTLLQCPTQCSLTCSAQWLALGLQ